VINKPLFIKIACFLSLGLLYNASATTLPTGQADADELTISAYLYSLPHPPGYPIFITISHPIIRLLAHFTTVAHAANIVAGWYGVITLFVIYETLNTVVNSITHQKQPTILISGISTIIIAFSYHFWLYSTIFEIFTFSTLCTAITIYSCFRWYYFQKPKWYWLSWLTFGILISHIQLGILLLPGWLLMQWFSFHQRPKNNFRTCIQQNVIGFIVAACVFFCINGLLFIQNHNQLNSWGMTASLKGWITHIARQDYSGVNLERDSDRQTMIPAYIFDDQTIKSMSMYLQMISQSCSPLIAVLLLISCIIGWKKHRQETAIISLWFITSGIALAGYMRLSSFTFEPLLYQGIGERQFSLSLIPIALLIALGIESISQIIGRSTKKVKCAFLLVVILNIGYQIANNMSVLTHKQNRTVAYQQAKTRLDSVESNALIICSNDIDCYSLFYIQDIEKYRTDVFVLSHKPVYKLSVISHNTSLYPYPTITAQDYFPLLLSWNVTKRPTYLASGINYYVDYIGLESGPFYLKPTPPFLFKVETTIPQNITAEPLPDFLSIPIDTNNKYALGIRESIGNSLAYAGYLTLRYQQPNSANVFLNQALQIDSTNRQTYKIINEQQQIQTYLKPTEPLSALAYVSLGDKADKEQQLQSAETYYRQATYKDPTNINALTTLRDFYQKYGIYDKASEIGQHLGIMSTAQ
jgi:hypothetical protein